MLSGYPEVAMRFPSAVAAMRRTGRSRALVAVLVSTALADSGCVWTKRRVDVVSVVPGAEARAIVNPVKAHLKDGSTVVFLQGASINGGSLIGAGLQHDLTLSKATPVTVVPLDAVAALETFRTRASMPETVLITLLATAAAVVGASFLAVAIFGSCPTVYSEDEQGPLLEAETFSHSIARLLESRDLDRLRARADGAGTVRLEVRNEALETHYINHLQLLEVAHAPGQLAVPDADGRPVILGEIRPFATAVDRDGRDAAPALAAADGVVFQTSPARLDAAAAGDLEDWIDLTTAGPLPPESALVFRLKNSLLSTVLFYDVMLAAAGHRAVDWLGSDLEQISTAVRLGRWVQRRLGLRVSVWRDGRYQEVARLPDAGPIAWREASVVVPIASTEPHVRLRLSFTADHWRIDRGAIAHTVRRAEARIVPVARITGADGRLDPGALAAVTSPDERYLQTSPGQRFEVAFETGSSFPGAERTFFLSSQGYYTEWVRGEWLRADAGGAPFTPSDDGLRTALRRWREVRGSMESDFARHRIPVR
jgi:hypothetical protein